MNEAKLSQDIEFVAEQGLNLLATLPCEELPNEIRQAMLAEAGRVIRRQVKRQTKEVGLDKALALLNRPPEGTHHRGDDDVWNIAGVLSTLLFSG